jgi:two-component system, cell cycle sensor histidine kinase and response regulator CckA
MRRLSELRSIESGSVPLKGWKAVAVTTSITAATIWVRLAIDDLLGGRPSLVMFTIPIMVSGYLAGLWGGLLATALVYFGASYYLLAPLHDFEVRSGVDQFQQLSILIAGVIVSVLNEALHRSRQTADTAILRQNVALAALRAGEERYRALVEWSPEAMVVHREGRVVFVNPAAVAMFGATSAQDLTGKHLAELTDPQSAYAAEESWLGHADEREAQPEVGLTLRRLSGASFDAEGRSAAITFDGEPAIVATLLDITKRQQAEQALRRAEKLEAVGQLAAGVAHEFNNILQTLMSMATLIRVRGGTEEIVKIAADMEVQIRRGANVTQQLLASSRHQEVTKTHLDLREQAVKAAGFLRRLIPENITLTVEQPSEPVSVEADAGQIQQVLLNLAINARDALPRGGTIILRIAANDTEAWLDVEDNGTGFDEKTRQHLFEPFFTTKELGKGTGLGLAVVYGIVKQHGGRIDVRSEAGKGSLFRVILPRTFGEEEAVSVVPETSFANAAGTILLVEDEEGVQQGLVMLLESIGYQVTAASSAEEALALPLTRAPDVLLSDVSLPGISGTALASVLTERWPGLKVTLMTGYLDTATRDLSAERSWDILTKPFELEQLDSHLATVLGREFGDRDRDRD